MAIDTVTWRDGKVRILDQTRLPTELVYRECGDWNGVAEAIRVLRVRGAPAIGVAAAYGVCVAAEKAADAATGADLLRALEPAIAGLAATRPTAVNLFWALTRMRGVLERDDVSSADADAARAALLAEADRILAEDRSMGEAIAGHGRDLIPENGRVLTHCNAGALATGGIGTALAVVVAAHHQGKRLLVYADETRPLLQGSRLTAWELEREGVDARVICDSAAGGLMARGEIDVVVVGADRIAANGDVANKVGTYPLAVLARYHGLPFYVAAPVSTIDLSIPSGREIPIEERDPAEVTRGALGRTAPAGVRAVNPAFDVTPADLVTAIVTDRGVVRAPYEVGLEAVVEGRA
jgi:methylthioribose-1-phosphate isomerase